MKVIFTVTLVTFFLFSAVYGSENGSLPDRDSKIVIMREVTVQGEFDNPAFIIVPKAKIYKKELFKNSYYNDIVRSIYFDPVKKRVGAYNRKENKKRR